MSDQQTIRFHRRVGFNVGGEIRYVDKGDHIDLPKEITQSPYFAAVMGDKLVETIHAAPPADGETVGIAEALTMLDSAKAEGRAEAQAEIDKAKAEAAEATKARDEAQAQYKKAQAALEKATKPAASKDK